MIAFASSLDQAGPFTRNVTDGALLLSHMVGHDPRDSTSVAMPEPIQLPTAQDLRGIRLGVPEELLGGADEDTGIEPGVRENFEATLKLAESLGATVDTCHLPHAPHALSAYYLIAPAEASANLARYDGVRYGLRVAGDADLETMYSRTRAGRFRARGQAADHARDLRAVQRLLRRLLRNRAEGAHEDLRGLPDGVR